MEINWDYEPEEFRGGRGGVWSWIHGCKYKHIGIHFEEDWKIHVIGSTVVTTTTLSKNKWHGKQREQEKALEKAYLHHPTVLTSYSIPSFMK